MTVETVTICIGTMVDEIIRDVRTQPGKEIETRSWASDRKLSSDQMNELVMEVFDRVNGFTAGQDAAKDLSLRIIPEPHPMFTSAITDVALTA